MNYNIECLNEPSSTFATRFTLPLWNYVVPPRTVEDTPYTSILDFASDPLFSFVETYEIQDQDILEIFELRKRVLFTGVQIEILQPVEGLVVKPVTNSGIIFDSIECHSRTRILYAIDGGKVDRTTDLNIHSRLIDDPDYFGIKIESGSSNLQNLAIRVELAVSDKYNWYAKTNYGRPN